MRRGFMIGFVVLGLTACGQGKQGSAENAANSGSAPASEAAKSEVGAAPSQDAASCVTLVSSANYSDAVPVCTRALSLDPANAKVKESLQTANAKLAEAAAAAAQGAADSAQDAAEKAQDAADEAKGAAKPY